MPASGTELRTYFRLKFLPVFKGLVHSSVQYGVCVCVQCQADGCPSRTLCFVWQLDIFLLLFGALYFSFTRLRLLILHFALHAKCCLQVGEAAARQTSRSKAKQLVCRMNFSNSTNVAWARARASYLTCFSRHHGVHRTNRRGRETQSWGSILFAWQEAGNYSVVN